MGFITALHNNKIRVFFEDQSDFLQVATANSLIESEQMFVPMFSTRVHVCTRDFPHGTDRQGSEFLRSSFGYTCS